jgi:hypothetical protein
MSSFMKGMPGGMLTVSANGSADGIVWATHLADQSDSQDALFDGVVAAFKATPEADGSLTKLWDSYQNQARDDVGSPGKFVPPTVTNGKVFVVSNGTNYDKTQYLDIANTDSSLIVYGLLPANGGDNGGNGNGGGNQ